MQRVLHPADLHTLSLPSQTLAELLAHLILALATGPHVMEVSVKGAHLTYPLTTMRSFCHDLVETYSHYVYPPWVDPYPQVRDIIILHEKRQPHMQAWHADV